MSSARNRLARIDGLSDARSRKAVTPILVTVVACGEEGRQHLDELKAEGYEACETTDVPREFIERKFVPATEMIALLRSSRSQKNGHNTHSNGDRFHE